MHDLSFYYRGAPPLAHELLSPAIIVLILAAALAVTLALAARRHVTSR